MSHNKIGDLLVEQGDLPAALEAYKTSLTIAEHLAGTDPSNAVWESDFALTRDRVASTEARLRQIIDAKKREEEERRLVAALEEARRERRRLEEERSGSALNLNEEERATFIKRVKEVLKQAGCYEGASSSDDAQKSLDRYINRVRLKGKDKPARIELSKATAGDFDSWLKEADDIKGAVCVPPPLRDSQSAEPVQEKSARRQADPQRALPRYSPLPSSGGGGKSPIQGVR